MKARVEKHVFKSLLAENATNLERGLEKALFRTTNLEAEIGCLWFLGEGIYSKDDETDQCPPDFLPYLAHALGVEIWDDAWSESEKRHMIAKYIWIRRLRGTAAAIKAAFVALGVHIEVVEWWQDDISLPANRKPYYFELKIHTRKNGYVSEENSRAIHDITERLKPLRAKYNLFFVYTSDAVVQVACVLNVTRITRLSGEVVLAS